MHPGRKILNLRHDLNISQQELARASSITPSALSKIESGINAPRAHILWRIAKYLGVSIEYILDEKLPYPYTGFTYKDRLLSGKQNPGENVRTNITREEKAFLEALRECNPIARDIALSIPEMPIEVLRVVHFLVHNGAQTARGLLINQMQDLIQSQDGPARGGTDDPPMTPRKAAAESRAARTAASKSRKKAKKKTRGSR